MTNLLTVFEVADYLRTTSTTIYRWLKQGKIKGIKIGKEWRIEQSSLSDLISNMNNRQENNETLWKNMNKSEHLMVITNSEDDLYELESSFFKYALYEGNRMLKGFWWQDIDEIREKYISNGFDITYHEKEGLIKLVDFAALYKKYGINGPVHSWYTEIENSKERVLWASGSPELNCCDGDKKKLVNFETNLNNTIRKMSVIGICPYVINEFEGDTFDTVMLLMQYHSGTAFFSNGNATLLRN